MTHRTSTSASRRSASTARPARAKAKDKDALALLKTDHQAVKKMFVAYKRLIKDEAEAGEKQELAADICRALTIHTKIEEEIFYPALREAFDDQALLDEAEIEHGTAKKLIAELNDMEPTDDCFDARVTVLSEYIDHHVSEEEGEMFTKARKADVDLAGLGEEMHARKEELDGQIADAGAASDEAPRKSRSAPANGRSSRANGRTHP